jgi:hypothetical protein
MKVTQAVVTWFTAVLVSFGVHIEARAESPSNPIDYITHLTGTIARNQLSLAPAEDDPDTDTSGDREKSMEFAKAGYEAEEAESLELALEYYIESIKADPTNPWAYLLAGRLIGNNDTGIECIRESARLFKAERNHTGYKLSVELLRSANAN